MIKKMSKRERILLFSAAVLIVVYLVVQFALLPLFSRLTDAETTLEALNSQRFSFEMDLANLPLMRDGHRHAQERLDSIRATYPELVPNEDIDVLMTSLVTRHNLSPTLLSITRPGTVAVVGAEEQGPEFFRLIRVTMNLIGSLDSLQRLVDEVDGINFMRITDLSHSEASDPNLSTQSVTFELMYVLP